MSTPDSRIWFFFKYAQKCFGEVGVKLKFPKGTDPKKTYKWRYLVHFVGRVDEWGISDQTGCKLINAMVQYSKHHNMLNRGIAILASNKVLEIGYEAIKSQIEYEDGIVARIEKDHKYISALGDNKLAVLLRREPNAQALPNLVKWSMQGKLSSLYIILSKSCREALSKLSVFDKSLLPNENEVMALKNQCFDNAVIKSRLKLTMGDEWYYGL